MTTGKTIALTRETFVSKLMSLLLNMLSSFVMAFLPRSKHLLISWLQSPSAVIWEAKKIKSVTVSTISPPICMEWWDQMPWSWFFECWVLNQFFHSPLSPSSRNPLVPLHSLPLKCYLLLIWGSLCACLLTQSCPTLCDPMACPQAYYINESFIWNTSANISHKKNMACHFCILYV